MDVGQNWKKLGMITGMDFKLNLLYQATLNVTNLDQTLSDHNKEMITLNQILPFN